MSPSNLPRHICNHGQVRSVMPLSDALPALAACPHRCKQVGSHHIFISAMFVVCVGHHESVLQDECLAVVL
jgi:hypothetical protein